MASTVRIITACEGLATPSAYANVICRIEAGAVLQVIEDVNREYYQVSFQGRPCFIRKAYTVAAEADAVEERGRLVDAAETVAAAPASTTIAASATTCPACGSAVRPGDPACPACGQALIARYASFGRRFLGWLIDGLIIGVPTIVVAIVIASIVAYMILSDAPDISFTPAQQAEQLQAEEDAENAAAIIITIVGLAGGLLGAVYYIAMNASGGTFGKRALGMRLEDQHTGENIGLGKSFIRYLVSIVSGIPLYLGYLWALWDSDKQTWHDKAAGSIVVEA